MLDFFWDILAFIVAISVLVAIHEYGHFWVARRLGFKVLRFSIGFGRPLLRWHGRDPDQVEYQISAIPLGGYVKMLDEREGEVDEAEAHRAFNRRPVPARIAVLAAGPGANFLFAIVAYWVMFVTGVEEMTPYFGGIRADSVADQAGIEADDVIESVGGQATPTLEQALVAIFDQLLDDGQIDLVVADADGSTREVSLDVRNRISELTEPDALFEGLGLVFGPQLPSVVSSVTEDAPAGRAGIQPGDRIVAIDDQRVEYWQDMQRYVSVRAGQSADFEIERNGQALSLPIEIEAVDDGTGEMVGRIGIGSGEYSNAGIAERLYTLRRYGPVEGIAVATVETWDRSVLSLRFLWRMITGDVSPRNLSGPIAIASFAGDYAQAGINRFLQFLAMISISLGIVNLLPVPILDGGQIVMCTAEAIKGRPLSMRAAIIGQQIGLAMIIALMGFVFYNDIARILGS